MGSSVTNPDKPGYLTLQVNGNAIEFHISDYEKYKETFTAKKVVEFFQEVQNKADQGNQAAKSLIGNLIEEPILPRTIRINAQEMVNSFDKTNGLTFGFKYNGTYIGADGQEHHYSPERMFAHEISHAAGERTQPEGNRNLDPRNVHNYRSEGQTREQFKQKVEEPAVTSENYVASEIFGAAAGVPRARYDKHVDNQYQPVLQTPAEVVASLPEHQRQVVEQQISARLNEQQILHQQLQTLERV